MSTFTEHDVHIQGDVELKGTLTIPEAAQGVCPAVLIIPGTGKMDRDGNLKQKKMQLNLYRELAEYVSELGFITLRFDKRGTGKSGGKLVKTGMWDLIDDAKQAVQLLKAHPAVDPKNIIVLGHSEGTRLGTILAASEEISGLILLGGGGEKLEEAMQRQQDLGYRELENKKGVLGWLFRIFKLEKKSEKKIQKLFKKVTDSQKDVIRIQLFFSFPAKWLREHLAYNVLEDLKEISCPVLAITGSKDLQADPAKLENVERLVPGTVNCLEIDNMDHMLKKSEAPASILKVKNGYIKNQSKPIHPKLKDSLREWLSSYN